MKNKLVSRKSYVWILSFGIIWILMFSSAFTQSVAMPASNVEVTQPLLSSIPEKSLNDLLSSLSGPSSGLNLDESIIGRDGLESYLTFDDAIGSFGNTVGDYAEIWEPWKTKAATHVVALSEDREFLAVGTGYLSDNEVHIYRWNPVIDQYVLVSVAGDGIIMSDVMDLSFGDIDSNGFIDLAVASMDGHIYLFEQAHVYDPIGSTENRFDLVWTSNRIMKASSVMIYDMDLDGFQDIVAGGWDGKIHVYEFRERTPYPFSEKHEKYLKEVFVSEDLGSPVYAVRSGDFDGDKLPDMIVGLRDGTIIIYENAGEVISTPNGPFPIAYDNYYVQKWKDNTTIWRPPIDLEVSDIDKDGKTEAAIVSLGLDVFLLDNTDINDEYILDRIVKTPANWETHGAYPIDYYMDVLINGSNIFFDSDLNLPEPMDWLDPGNKVSPYTSGMANKSLDHYSLLRASAGTVWALMDWGEYEEVVSSGNKEADILIHLNSPYLGDLSNINLTISRDFENWFYLDSNNFWLSEDGKTIYIDVDPVTSQLQWKYFRYMNMTLTGSHDMEIVYWEAARINLRLGDARSAMFTTMTRGSDTETVLTVGISDGRFLTFEYVPASERQEWESRMKLIYDSYIDELFKLDTGGAWSIFPDPLHRTIPNWINPEIPGWTDLSTIYNVSTILQAQIVPNIHPFFYTMGDDAEYDLVFMGNNSRMGFVPDPYMSDVSGFVTYSQQLFDNIFSEASGFNEDFRFAFGDFIHFSWENEFPIPEIIVSAFRPSSSFLGEGFGGGTTYIRIYYLPDWENNASKLQYLELQYTEPYGLGQLDQTGALYSLSKSILKPLILGSGDFDGDGFDDLVASDGTRLYLFKQLRNNFYQNGSLVFVPGFFDDVNRVLETKKYKIQNIQGIDVNNDTYSDLIISLDGRYGFTFFENVGNSLEPIWVEKRTFVNNRNPSTAFTNYNYEFGLIWPGSKDFDSGADPVMNFIAINDTGKAAIFNPSTDYQEAWVVATYPEVKVVLVNFMQSTSFQNYGFQYLEAWSNKLNHQNWTMALTTGVLDRDKNYEIVVADYDNNLYVFEYLTNNTYKISYRSNDLVYNIPTYDTPYESDVLIGMDNYLNRSVFENGRYVVAGYDLDNDGYLEIILATERQIYWFEHTGYNDEYMLNRVIVLPPVDYLASDYSQYIEQNLDFGITALAACDDVDGNKRGEILVGYNQYLLMFELSADGRFREVLGYDVSNPFSERPIREFPNLAGPGNGFLFPYSRINAILVYDINEDGYMDIIIGGSMNYELNGYPGFLRVLSMNDPYDPEAPYYYWKEVWNEKNIIGFLERSYVTSIAIDDQNLDGDLEVLVGHAHGVEILKVVDPRPYLSRVTSISGNPGYPIENYFQVKGYPDNNETNIDLYSASITQNEGGYYFLANSEFVSGVEKTVVTLRASQTPEILYKWNPAIVLSGEPGAASANYSADKEIMPSITYSNGYWFITWVALNRPNKYYTNVQIWVAATNDFENWNIPFLKIADYNMVSDNPSLYYTTPKVVPIPGTTPSFLVASAFHGSGIIVVWGFTVTSTIDPYDSAYPYNFLLANVPGANYNSFDIQGIGLTDVDPTDNIFELAVSMTLIGDNSTNPSRDIWYVRMIPGFLNETHSGTVQANWTRVTKTTNNEIFPAITPIGNDYRRAVLISFLIPGAEMNKYAMGAVTGAGVWPDTWSDVSIIPTQPYSYHQLINYNGNGPANVFDATFMDGAFSSEAELPNYPQYSYFDSKLFITGVPALYPYMSGYVLVYPTRVYDYSHTIEYTYTLGSRSVTVHIPNNYDDIYIAINPYDSYAFTNLKNVKDIAVGDTDKDGRREIGVAYEKTAELLELAKWSDSTSTILYETIWQDLTYLQKDVKETMGIELFDSNGNGFEEIILASRGGYVRSYEFANLLAGVSDGSVLPRGSGLGDLPGIDFYSIDSAYWDESHEAIVAGGTNTTSNYAVIYYFLNASLTGLEGAGLLTSAAAPRFDKVLLFLVDNGNKSAVIVGIYDDLVNPVIVTFFVDLVNGVSKQVSVYTASNNGVLDNVGGRSIDFRKEIFVDKNSGNKFLLIPMEKNSVLINSTGGISTINTVGPTNIAYLSTVADINGDNEKEILCLYDNSTLGAWRINGSLIKTYDLPNDYAPSTIWTGLTVIDINRDGINDILAYRDNDHLLFAFSGTDGTQLWNTSLPALNIMFFRAMTINGETSVFIASHSTKTVMMALSLQGQVKWVYEPTNPYYYLKAITYNELTNKFLLTLSNKTTSPPGVEITILMNHGGAVEGITSTYADSRTLQLASATMSATGYYVNGSNLIGRYLTPTVISIYPITSTTQTNAYYRYFTITNAESYKVATYTDSMLSYQLPIILYSLKHKFIISLVYDEKFYVKAMLNYSDYGFDFSGEPVILPYTENENYLVFNNRTHVIFIKIETLEISEVLPISDNVELYATKMYVHDVDQDGKMDLLVFSSTTIGFYYYFSNYQTFVTIYSGADHLNYKDYYLGELNGIRKVVFNYQYIGLVVQRMVFSGFYYYMTGEARIYYWDGGLLSAENYTSQYYVNLELPPIVGGPDDLGAYLLSNDGNVYFDTKVGDPSSTINTLGNIGEVLLFSPSSGEFYVKSASLYIDVFRAYQIYVSGTYKSFLLVIPEYSSVYLFDNSGLVSTISSPAQDTQALITENKGVLVSLYLLRGKYLQMVSPIDLSVDADKSFVLSDYIETASYWSLNSPLDFWGLTRSNQIVFYGEGFDFEEAYEDLNTLLSEYESNNGGAGSNNLNENSNSNAQNNQNTDVDLTSNNSEFREIAKEIGGNPWFVSSITLIALLPIVSSARKVGSVTTKH